MRRLPLRSLIATIVVSLSIAACDGGGGGTPDAPPPPPPDGPPAAVCGTPSASISTYPGTFAGAILGSGADQTVARGVCADERSYFAPIADDQVVELTGLTPGALYLVDLVTTEDLSFYVATMCDAAGPTATGCLLFVDETVADERGDFRAPANGRAAVVIDAFAMPAAPDTGMYTLNVRQIDCADAFDCTTAATPTCDAMTNTCVAGPDMCTGDIGEPDDGPAAATVLTAPTLAMPTTVNAAVCSVPQFVETDFYTFTLAARGGIRVNLSWTLAGADLDVFLGDDTGGLIDSGAAAGAGPEILVNDLPAGTYYINVIQYDPMDTAAATPYTLTLSVPDCLNNNSFQCLNPAAPVCDNTGTCVGGFALCTGDDAADAGPGGDDGPAAASVVVAAVGVPQVFNRSACNSPAGLAESDWYKATMLSGQGMTLSLGFLAAEDFDIYAYDSTGAPVGLAFWLNPEVVQLTYLPAGLVYFQVDRFDPPGVAASAYTATFTRGAAQTCTTSADCAAVYSNQFYRGACTAGACNFIPAGAGANGTACDSADDCTSGFCSYVSFESDAQDSVCSTSCTTTAECAAVGTGLACTTGFGTNFCLPSCATDAECGTVDLGTPPPAPPDSWDYLTCTVAAGTCGP